MRMEEARNRIAGKWWLRVPQHEKAHTNTQNSNDLQSHVPHVHYLYLSFLHKNVCQQTTTLSCASSVRMFCSTSHPLFLPPHSPPVRFVVH